MSPDTTDDYRTRIEFIDSGKLQLAVAWIESKTDPYDVAVMVDITFNLTGVNEEAQFTAGSPNWRGMAARIVWPTPKDFPWHFRNHLLTAIQTEVDRYFDARATDTEIERPCSDCGRPNPERDSLGRCKYCGGTT